MTSPSAPILATVPGVEVASVGFWNISNKADFHPSAADLAAAVAALDCPAVRRPTLKFGHTGTPGEGDPAIGLVDELRLTEDGQTLVGDFVGVPAWLASADAEGRSVIASAYPDRSGEFQKDYTCQLGHVHPFVMHAVALLGVMRPGIGTLESLYDLYAKAPTTQEAVMEKAATLLAGTSIDEVRKAFYNNGPGVNYMLWIREMFVEPPELIVQDDDNDSLLRVPYSIGTDGAVEFGDSQAVQVEYVNARAAAETPTLLFASRADARPAPQSTSAAEAEANTEKEGTVPDLAEVAKRLGIAETADADTVLAALDEALAERADETTVEQPAPVPVVPELVAASASAPATVLVDRNQYEATVLAAQQGAEARAQQILEAAERKVGDAIAEGKIRPADRATYLGFMEINAARTSALLDSMPKGLVPIEEAGHGKQSEATDLADLSWFDSAPTEPATTRKDG